LGLPRR